MNSWMDGLKDYFEARNHAWVTVNTKDLQRKMKVSRDTDWFKSVHRLITRKHRALQFQGKRLLRVHSKIRVYDVVETNEGNTVKVRIEEIVYWVYQDRERLDVESRVIQHRQEWQKNQEHWTLVLSEESNERDKEHQVTPHWLNRENYIEDFSIRKNFSQQQRAYDRVQAIRYAELWWNGNNPSYPALADDCTNFISQCLFAGRMPMTGGQSRNSGWWFKFESHDKGEPWSYSWTTSHALYQYLIYKAGAFTVSSARQLKMGDLIFYDWNGSGKFYHTAIVTEFDEYGDPVVNAHTDASYHRPYAYLDSRAWTHHTRYAFVHLPDKFE